MNLDLAIIVSLNPFHSTGSWPRKSHRASLGPPPPPPLMDTHTHTHFCPCPTTLRQTGANMRHCPHISNAYKQIEHEMKHTPLTTQHQGDNDTYTLCLDEGERTIVRQRGTEAVSKGISQTRDCWENEITPGTGYQLVRPLFDTIEKYTWVVKVGLLHTRRAYILHSHSTHPTPYAHMTTGGLGLHGLLVFAINLNSRHSCGRREAHVWALRGNIKYKTKQVGEKCSTGPRTQTSSASCTTDT